MRARTSEGKRRAGGWRSALRAVAMAHVGGTLAVALLTSGLLLLVSSPAQGQQRFNKLAVVVAEGLADQGFWTVTPGLIPEAKDPEDGGAPLTPKQRFQARLKQIDLDGAECSALFPKGSKQLTLLVHGIGGAGEEWEPAVGPLSARGTPLLMYRWMPTGSREALARSLAAGINRLTECLEGNPLRLLIVAHSAGGVLAATAAPMLKPKDAEVADRVALVTVASPLGGMSMRGGKGPRGWQAFVEELGGSLNDYAAGPPGLRVLHVRTHPGIDKFARASSPVGHDAGFVPPGIPGARTLDLDETVDHSAAVEVAAKALAKDTWKIWQAQSSP